MKISPATLQRMQTYRPWWDWEGLRGASYAIKWTFRDMLALDEVIPLVRDLSCAVQAGGNIGLFPKRLAESFERVITFEPSPELFGALRKNAPEANIEAINAAIGNSHDGVSLSSHRRENVGRPNHGALTHVAGAGDIPQMRIDDLGLQSCGLIYLDIEGYEWPALRGALGTIKRCRPVIVAEINRNQRYYGHDPERLKQWIAGQGYVMARRMNADYMFLPAEWQAC